MSRKAVIFTLVTVLTLTADQISKWLVRENVAKAIERVEVIPGFFQLVHVENTGAAFGLLDGWEYAMWVFAVFTLVALAVLASLYREVRADARWMPAALGLILSGALGNGIDRIHKQAVTDFLRVYTDHPSVRSWLLENLGTAEYPSFNVADVAISVGVAMFMFSEIFLRRREAPDETLPEG